MKLSFLLALLLVCISAVHTAAQCPNMPTTKWSTLYASAEEGSSIEVTQNVLLDVSTPVLGRLNIKSGGSLVFDPNSADPILRLRSKSIIIDAGGALLAGCENSHFEKEAEIIIYGKKSDYTYDQINIAPGVKALVSRGTLKIFAKMPGLPWTVLAKTAPFNVATQEGVDEVEVVGDVSGWRTNDTIVFASTDYDIHQTEKRTIKSISGNKIVLNENLKYMHYGRIWQGTNGDFIDMRGEVGILNRRFRFYGDISDGESGDVRVRFGGHIFIYSGVAQIHGVEFFQAGQAAVLARYPVHFHVARDMPDSWVKKCSFHDTYQRCLTIHFTNGVLVENNVAYNSSGHCYFMEDGIEMGNTLSRNLGMLVVPPFKDTKSTPPIDHRVIQVDEEPSVFWITHPPNHFYDNVAVGAHWGYWFSLPKNAIGVGAIVNSENKFVWPRYHPMGDFKRNKAHSIIRDGLFIDKGITRNPECPENNIETCGHAPESTSYNPKDFDYTDIPAGTSIPASQLESFISARPAKVALIEDFIGYKCREVALWVRGSNMWSIRPKLADNKVGAQLPGDGNLIFNGVFVGETDNVGTPSRPEEEQGRSRPVSYSMEAYIAGYRHYDAGGPDAVYDSTFHNFYNYTFKYSYAVRRAGAFGAQGGPNTIPSRNLALRNRFYNTPMNNRFVFEGDATADKADVAHKCFAFVDADGSLTDGLKGGGCGSYIVANSAHLHTPDCKHISGWNAQLCRAEGVSPARRYFRLDYQNNQVPATVKEPVPCCSNRSRAEFIRLDNGVRVRLEPRAEDPYSAPGEPTPQIDAVLSFQSNIVVNTEFMILFGSDGLTPKEFTLNLHHSKGANPLTGDSAEFVRVAIPFPPGTTFNLSTNYDAKTYFQQVNSKSELTFQTFYFDNTSGILWVHLETAQDEFRYWGPSAYYNTRAWAYVYAKCPGNKCTVANPVVPIGQSPPPQRPFANDCQAGGSYSRGNYTYSLKTSPSAAKREYIFDESLRPGWNGVSWTQNWNYSTNLAPAQVPPGTHGIALYSDWKDYASTQFRNLSNNAAPFYLTTQTHFSMRVRSGYRAGPSTLSVRFLNPSGQSYKAVNLNNPWYLAGESTPDESEWVQVIIPLKDLGLSSTTPISGFTIGNNVPRPNRIFYDELYFGEFDLKIQKAVVPQNIGTGTTDVDYSRGGSNGSGSPASTLAMQSWAFALFAAVVAIVLF